MEGIYFPGFGIELGNVPSGINLFGFEIKLYGVVITLGFFLAMLIAQQEAKQTGLNDEDVLDYLLWMIVPTILGARLYYIIFSWKDYFVPGRGFKATFLDIINLRNGGLAIYGGVIAGILVAVFFCKKRKIYLPLFADNISMGILLGQIMGRWGNFFNREAFGAYTTSVFRMAIPVSYYENHGLLAWLTHSGIITQQMLDHTEVVNGLECITVYPTYLFEGGLNLLVLIFIFLYRKHKKFDGELAMIYVAGYGLVRFFVEGLRADSLMIGSIKVSQLLGLLCFIAGISVMIYNYVKIKKGKEVPNHPALHLLPPKRVKE